MTPNHVKQRIRRGQPAFGSLLNFGLAAWLEPPHREVHEAMEVLGRPLVGMDQRFLTSAAKAARDAVTTDR